MKADCARCRDKECQDGKDCYDLARTVRDEYSDGELASMRVSGEIEAEHYMKLTRIEELALYASMMGMKKVGVAFCVGLSNEARVVADVLESKGLEVHSVCCKVCGIDKDDVGVVKMHGDGKEAVCNPIGQASSLERCGTELNVIVGLCVGHDILFTERSRAPVSTLIVKDRVLAHNPVGAVYSAYYKETRFGLKPE
ncbi:TPA: DUF1847 domain-containing protein [Thermoplasmata archaeon]|nr:DUF1847 domain-containing protein [Thermoplasmata archaeon]